MTLARPQLAVVRASRRRGGGAVVIPPRPAGELLRYSAADGMPSAGGKATSLTDLSGNGHHATVHNGGPFASLDYAGKPVARFVGGAAGSAYLTAAAGVTVDARSYSVFIVGRMLNDKSGSFISSPASTAGLLRMVKSVGVVSKLYAGGRDLTIKARHNEAFIGVTSGTGGITAHTAATDHIGLTAQTAGTGLGLTIGRLNTTDSVASYPSWEFRELIYYPRQLTGAEVAALRAHYAALHPDLRLAAATDLFLTIGDSITEGTGVEQLQSWPVQTYRDTLAQWRMTNTGASGAKLADLFTNAAQTDAYLEATGYTRKVLMGLIGRNDGATVAADTWYSDPATGLVKFVQDRLAAGWTEVWWGTPLKTGASLDSTLQAYADRITGVVGNGLVADAGANRVVDLRALPGLQDTSGANPNFQGDATHPSRAGALLIADAVAAELAA